MEGMSFGRQFPLSLSGRHLRSGVRHSISSPGPNRQRDTRAALTNPHPANSICAMMLR